MNNENSKKNNISNKKEENLVKMNEFSNKNFINPNDINVDLDIINGKPEINNVPKNSNFPNVRICLIIGKINIANLIFCTIEI